MPGIWIVLRTSSESDGEDVQGLYEDWCLRRVGRFSFPDEIGGIDSWELACSRETKWKRGQVDLMSGDKRAKWYWPIDQVEVAMREQLGSNTNLRHIRISSYRFTRHIKTVVGLLFKCNGREEQLLKNIFVFRSWVQFIEDKYSHVECCKS